MTKESKLKQTTIAVYQYLKKNKLIIIMHIVALYVL